MRKQHLIALDLDGTLLNDNKTISTKTKHYLAKLIQEGHIVVIATGRPYRACQQYYHELQLSTPIVNFNGAFVHHPKNKSWGPYHSPLELASAKEIFDLCEQLQVKNVMVEVIDDIYLRKKDEFFVNTFVFDNAGYQTGMLHTILKEDPTSILIHPHEHQVDMLRSSLRESHAEIIDHRNWGAPYNVIEIVKLGSNKAEGLKRIAQYFGIPRERIIAFGDEDNDFEMIEYAGHGIAMGNAIDPLKSLANHITLTNEEEGVAVFLQDYFKIK